MDAPVGGGGQDQQARSGTCELDLGIHLGLFKRRVEVMNRSRIRLFFFDPAKVPD